ncbi:peptidoglycan D,D-transpeptidase FtsI family protein [Plantibacter sp. YIM 135249]|uniref:peptidoglycan D,D-transpeptidase FtsI family protein n=1 Tax=Plantibacter sp. YIM 135249 TaxID=3423918 RepID=UPI003D3545A4
MVSHTKSTKRRLAASVLAVSLIVGLFVVRLVDIQVVRASELTAESLTKTEVSNAAILSTRGSILDANGEVLATAVLRYNVQLSPKDAGPFERTVDGKENTISLDEAGAEIGAVIGQPGPAIVAIITDALAINKDSDYAEVAKSITAEQLKALDALDIPWLYFKPDPSRVYPNGAVAGNLVGFVGSEGEAQAGIELKENSCLAGHDGTQTYEKSRDGVPLPGTLVTDQAKNGGDVVLTIDANLQWFAQQALAAQAQATGASWGVVTVMEVKTGKLLAVADYPTVDPGNVGASDADDRGSRAFQAPFEPGSTYKTITAAALLDQGAAHPNDQVVAPYRIKPANGADINDSDRHGDLRLTLTGVLVQSSNTGMSQFGELLSPKTRYDYFEKDGQTKKTEVGFPGESGGIMNDYQDWDNQTHYTTMFGQGFSTTAIQGASLYQTVANGGVRMPVQLVEGCKNADGTFTKTKTPEGTRVFSEEAAAGTTSMLEMVDQNSWVANLVDIPGYRVAMKTGTAQQPDGDGGYSHSYLVSIAGYAPAEAPQYVVSVNLADPVKMNTSAAAAPLFRDVMTQVLKTRGVQPSTTTATDLPLDY